MSKYKKIEVFVPDDSEPHLVRITTNNDQTQIEHLKEDGWIDRQKVFEVIDTVKAQYPASVFPDNGTSPDAKAGMVARLICDNIKREMEIMFNEEPPTTK